MRRFALVAVGARAALAIAVLFAISAAGASCSRHVPAALSPPRSADAAPPRSVALLAAPVTPVFPADWSFPPGSPAAASAQGMVVTDSALATKVGALVLAGGGNAADAAVATAFALAVVFPTAGNIGGGGFLVARVEGKSYALDFRETAPSSSTHDMYLGPDGKPTRDSRDGPRSAGVPGSVAGMWEAWRTLGSKRKAWAELIAPAIALADGGFVVDAGFRKSIAMMQPRLVKYPASAALFLPNGDAPAVGSTWRNPDIAGVLRRIAERGPDGFYEGPVADAVARVMKDSGGLITLEDLKGYRAKWRTPVEYDYRRRHVIGMPPPSSGGVTMAMVAHILEGFDLGAKRWHSPDEIHLVIEAMRRAFAARNAKLGDPDFVKNPVDELMSSAWSAQQRATIKPDRATTTAELFPGVVSGENAGPHTTHMAVVDAAGNAVSLTTTLNLWFGSGVTVPGAGFVLNDEMDDFASVPGTANAFGLVQGEPNAIAPRKRMLSSMSPTIVLGTEGRAELVLGAAGGSRIITTVFQELSNVVDFGMSLSDAVSAPRFHQQDWPDVLLLESHSLPEDVRQTLERMGHATKDVDHIADAPAIAREGGRWLGAAEPRREGSLGLGP
jgi:gamma-glutamyltranspeptidase/glutathione hydrolase